VVLDQADFIHGLGRLGLGPGSLVFMHSSMRSLGKVQGGPRTVVSAILELLGPQGTLAVPIYHDFFLKGPAQVWDTARSPSKMGILSELVRTWPEAVRCAHPSHPIAAIGPLAGELAALDQGSACGKNSLLMRLVEQNAAVLLLGVGYKVCTLFHLAEELSRVPYREWVTLSGTVIRDGVATQKKIPFYRRRLGYCNDFTPCGRDLELAGKVASVKIGNALARRIRAKALLAFTLDKIGKDPMYLARKRTLPVLGRQFFQRLQAMVGSDHQ
jgi:aminoglycoside 3-N-acetyltransferase